MRSKSQSGSSGANVTEQAGLLLRNLNEVTIMGIYSK